MKTKIGFILLFFFVGICFCLCVVGSDSKGKDLLTKNLEAFAGAVDVTIDVSPSSSGYCRCKNGGCYAGNMISFRANCGQVQVTTTTTTTTETGTTVTESVGYQCSTGNCQGEGE